MHAFDPSGRIKRYGSAWEVVGDFLPLRGALYAARQAAQVDALTHSLGLAQSKARFLGEVVAGRLEVGRAGSKEALCNRLAELGFPTATALGGVGGVGGRGGGAGNKGNFLHASTFSHPGAHRVIDVGKVMGGGGAAPPSASSSAAAAASSASVTKGYDYLLHLPLWSLTQEAVGRSGAAVGRLERELKTVVNTRPEDMWKRELQVLKEVLKVGGEGGRPNAY
jgi:DNA topoisomerase-2